MVSHSRDLRQADEREMLKKKKYFFPFLEQVFVSLADKMLNSSSELELH